MSRAALRTTVVPVPIPSVPKNKQTKRLSPTVIELGNDEQAKFHALKLFAKKVFWSWVAFVFLFIIGSFCVLGVQAAGLKEMQTVLNKSNREVTVDQERCRELRCELASAKHECLKSKKIEQMKYPNIDNTRIICK